MNFHRTRFSGVREKIPVRPEQREIPAKGVQRRRDKTADGIGRGDRRTRIGMGAAPERSGGVEADFLQRRLQRRPALQPSKDDLERAEDLPHKQEDADRPFAPQSHSGRQKIASKVRHSGRRGQAVRAGQRERNFAVPVPRQVDPVLEMRVGRIQTQHRGFRMAYRRNRDAVPASSGTFRTDCVGFYV